MQILGRLGLPTYPVWANPIAGKMKVKTMRERFWLVLSSAILLLVGAILAACTSSRAQVTTPIQQSVATSNARAATPVVEVVATPEPLIPTLVPAQGLVATVALSVTVPVSVSQSATPPSLLTDKTPVATSTQAAAVTNTAAGSSTLKPGDLRSRLGVGIAQGATAWTFDEAMAQRLGMGWYLDWQVHASQHARREQAKTT